MDREPKDVEHVKKKERPIDREQNTALYLLRCAELRIPMSDLELLDMGMIFDMMTERGNDHWDGWSQLATQEDFRRF